MYYSCWLLQQHQPTQSPGTTTKRDDEMLCTQTILETYRELTEHEEHCDHPWDARYPLDGEWEVCTKCGEKVRPDDWVPF